MQSNSEAVSKKQNLVYACVFMIHYANVNVRNLLCAVLLVLLLLFLFLSFEFLFRLLLSEIVTQIYTSFTRSTQKKSTEE